MNTHNKVFLDLGQEHITIQRRYEALGAFNDLLIALWFLIGSFLFLTHSLVESGTWLFIAGSAQLLIKPIIKLTSLIHVSRVYHTEKR
ncbi:YrhK family protein [Sulfurospirillum sp. 1612]|uniref:YrhK family protein n=1 Tax=Sulfurospirillum sp. 1612 TaxID=3094835 RepID=UPI002F94764F